MIAEVVLVLVVTAVAMAIAILPFVRIDWRCGRCGREYDDDTLVQFLRRRCPCWKGMQT